MLGFFKGKGRKGSESVMGITVWLPREIFERVDAISKKTGMSRSSILRSIILKHLEELEKFEELAK